MSEPKFRAKSGAYTRHWSIQVKRWWGWNTVHSGHMEQGEAQAFLDRLVATNGQWETLYPGQPSLRFKCGACQDSGWLWDFNKKVPCDVCESGPAWLNAQTKDAGDAPYGVRS